MKNLKSIITKKIGEASICLSDTKKCVLTDFALIRIVDEIMKEIEDYEFKQIQIDTKEEDILFWKFGNPDKINNYIVNKGAEGVSLGWWNGEEWIEMWGDKKLNVSGWITLPKFDKIFNS